MPQQLLSCASKGVYLCPLMKGQIYNKWVNKIEDERNPVSSHFSHTPSHLIGTSWIKANI